MEKRKRPQWQTPKIKSLEINIGMKCVRLPQARVCQSTGQPISSTPCDAAQKGSPNQPLS